MELTGRLTGDAQVSEVKGGKKVVNFNIAINDSYKPKDGDRVELTTYVACAYWINVGVAEYLKKGLLVQLYGRIGSRAWANSDGEAQSALTCNVANLKFLGAATKSTTKPETSNANTPDDDDLPF